MSAFPRERQKVADVSRSLWAAIGVAGMAGTMLEIMVYARRISFIHSVISRC